MNPFTPFGLPEGVNLKEYTTKTYYDTLLLEEGTALADTDLFTTASKDSQFRNTTFPNQSLTTEITIVGMQVQHNLAFAIGSDAGFEKAYQEYHDRFSYIRYEKESKGYGWIPIEDLVPYQYYTNGAALVAREKRTDYYPLLDPILVPKGGEIVFQYKPAKGLILAATATGFLGAISALDDNKGFYLRVKLFAWVKRSMV